jgi:hypothetical protein
MLIDDFLPIYEQSLRHAIDVNAPPTHVYPHVRAFDISRPPVIRALYVIRGLPLLLSSRGMPEKHPGLTLEEMLKGGFILLGERPPTELLLGAIGRFWTPSGDLQTLTPDAFRAFDTPGFVKAAWCFVLTEREPGRTCLETETRLHCADATARRRFLPYWWLIAPFTHLVRRAILHAIKRAAESP